MCVCVCDDIDLLVYIEDRNELGRISRERGL